MTWLLYLQNGLYGWFLYAFTPAVALLREEVGYSRAVGGLHGTLFAVGAVGAGLLQARAVGRFGRPRALWGGVAGFLLGAMLFAFGPALPVTLLGAFCAGAAGSLLLGALIAALAEHHGPAGPAAITETNAVAAGVGAIAPLALGGGIALGVGWRPALLLLAPFAVALWLAMGRVRIPDAHPLPHQTGPRRLPGRYWLAWAALVCFVGVEFCVTIWGADLVRGRTQVTAGAATAAVSAFLVGVLIGRVGGARLAMRYDTVRLLLASIVLCGGGFALLWTAPAYPVAVVALLMVGLGAALQFPLGAARAIGVAGGLTDLASGRNGVAAGVAAGAFPFVLGALADRVGVQWAFLVVPTLLAVAAGCLLATRRPEPVAA